MIEGAMQGAVFGGVAGGLTAGIGSAWGVGAMRAAGYGMMAAGGAVDYAQGGLEGLANFGAGLIGAYVGESAVKCLGGSDEGSAGNGSSTKYQDYSSKAGRIVLFPPDSPFYQASMDANLPDNILGVFSHYSWLRDMGIEQLEQLIDTKLQPGMQLALIACNGGSGGIFSLAAQLAAYYQTPVTAANSLVWATWGPGWARWLPTPHNYAGTSGSWLRFTPSNPLWGTVTTSPVSY